MGRSIFFKGTQQRRKRDFVQDPAQQIAPTMRGQRSNCDGIENRAMPGLSGMALA